MTYRIMQGGMLVGAATDVLDRLRGEGGKAFAFQVLLMGSGEFDFVGPDVAYRGVRVGDHRESWRPDQISGVLVLEGVELRYRRKEWLH